MEKIWCKRDWLKLGGLWWTNCEAGKNLENIIHWSEGACLLWNDLIVADYNILEKLRDTDTLHLYNFVKYFYIYSLIDSMRLEGLFLSRNKGQ